MMIEVHFSSHERPRHIGNIHIFGVDQIESYEDYLDALDMELNDLRNIMARDYLTRHPEQQPLIHSRSA